MKKIFQSVALAFVAALALPALAADAPVAAPNPPTDVTVEQVHNADSAQPAKESKGVIAAIKEGAAAAKEKWNSIDIPFVGEDKADDTAGEDSAKAETEVTAATPAEAPIDPETAVKN